MKVTLKIIQYEKCFGEITSIQAQETIEVEMPEEKVSLIKQLLGNGDIEITSISIPKESEELKK